ERLGGGHLYVEPLDVDVAYDLVEILLPSFRGVRQLFLQSPDVGIRAGDVLVIFLLGQVRGLTDFLEAGFQLSYPVLLMPVVPARKADAGNRQQHGSSDGPAHSRRWGEGANSRRLLRFHGPRELEAGYLGPR